MVCRYGRLGASDAEVEAAAEAASIHQARGYLIIFLYVMLAPFVRNYVHNHRRMRLQLSYAICYATVVAGNPTACA